jgi:hypothetical protein
MSFVAAFFGVRADTILAEDASQCPPGYNAVPWDETNVIAASCPAGYKQAEDLGNVDYYKAGQSDPNVDEKGEFALSQCSWE